MHVAEYLGLLHGSEKSLAEAFQTVALHHRDDVDIEQTCKLLGTWSDEHVAALAPVVKRYHEAAEREPEDLSEDLFRGPRKGALAMIRDLHDVWLLASEVKLCWTILDQAAKALRDQELETLCTEKGEETQRQISWLMTRIKQAAPQALVVAE